MGGKMMECIIVCTIFALTIYYIFSETKPIDTGPWEEWNQFDEKED
jgi:hypothetical protein